MSDTSHQLAQPFRHSARLGCCFDSIGARRCVDSIGQVIRLALSNGSAAAPRATKPARPTSALCDEIVIEFEQLLGLQADALKGAFKRETAGRRAAADGEAFGAAESS